MFNLFTLKGRTSLTSSLGPSLGLYHLQQRRHLHVFSTCVDNFMFIHAIHYLYSRQVHYLPVLPMPIMAPCQIDRLMTETKLDPSAAFHHISNVLGQVRGDSWLRPNGIWKSFIIFLWGEPLKHCPRCYTNNLTICLYVDSKSHKSWNRAIAFSFWQV